MASHGGLAALGSAELGGRGASRKWARGGRGVLREPRQPLCSGAAAGWARGVMEGPGLGSQVSAAGRGRRWGPKPRPGEAVPRGQRGLGLGHTKKDAACPLRWPQSEVGRSCLLHSAAGRYAPAPKSAGTCKVSGDTPQAAQPALDLSLESERFC